MEVVAAESDHREQQAEQSRYGPIDGVNVHGGLNHLFPGGKQFVGLELVDCIVPKQTHSLVQEGRVRVEDRQPFEVEVNMMGIDVQELLLFGVEDVVLEQQFAS